MKISQKGLKIIKGHETLVLEAYPDPGYGWKVPTIGWGHTGPDVKRGDKITKKRADQLLLEDLGVAERAVSVNVNVPLTQNQFDALVSLVFNIGVGRFMGSTLLKKLNAGDYMGAANEFPKWRKSNGQVMGGLIRRRAEEKALFLSEGTDWEINAGAKADLDTGKPPIKSTTNWSAILQTVLTNIAAFAAFDWKTALVFALVGSALTIYIMRERSRHGVEGMV